MCLVVKNEKNPEKNWSLHSTTEDATVKPNQDVNITQKNILSNNLSFSWGFS